MVGARGPYVHLPGNVISVTVGLVYINLQPEYELPSSTGFEQFRKSGGGEMHGIGKSWTLKNGGSSLETLQKVYICYLSPD